MPVRFPCRSCRTTLSIARRKIGTEVQCPRCGTSVEVPTEEVAAAGLAMKESTRSGSAGSPDADPLSQFVVYDGEGEEEEPSSDQVMSSPDGPPPMETAAPQTEPAARPEIDQDGDTNGQADEVSDAEDSDAEELKSSGSPPPPEKKTPPPRPGPTVPPPLKSKTKQPPKPGPSHAPPSSKPPLSKPQGRQRKKRGNRLMRPSREVDWLLVSRAAIYLQGAILLVLALLFFAFGFMIGRGTGGSAGADSEQAGEDRVLLAGQVSYRDAEGIPRADTGTVVLVLPRDRTPTPKIEAAPLAHSEPYPDEGSQPMLAIEELGGRYGRVEHDGSFALVVAEPGDYYLVLVSAGKTRGAAAGLDEVEFTLLQDYFSRSRELIGRQAYNIEEVTLTRGLVRKEHTFGDARL